MQKEINKFIDSISSKKDIDSNKFNEIKEKKYYLDYNRRTMMNINFLEIKEKEELDEKEKKKSKINIKFKYDKFKITYPYVYNIPEIYEKICNYIDIYYKVLDYNLILKEKDEFNKIIIYLLFYVKFIKNNNEEGQNKRYNHRKINLGEIEYFLINCIEK